MENCEFCLEFDKDRKGENLFNRLFGVDIHRILFETQNFVGMPGIGALLPGYLLIIPLRHSLSIAQLPLDQRNEFESLKEKIRDVLTRHYMSPIFFEHGSLDENSKSGCCIYHAHLHALPFAFNIFKDLQGLNSKKVESIFEAAEWLNNGNSYIYFETQQEEKYVFTCPPDLPSQYIRRVLAKKLGIQDEWDWQLWINEENVLRTLTDLSDEKNLK
jgi:diadenosine tetraphosphate (Ap4A) HIT family hydrolase